MHKSTDSTAFQVAYENCNAFTCRVPQGFSMPVHEGKMAFRTSTPTLSCALIPDKRIILTVPFTGEFSFLNSATQSQGEGPTSDREVAKSGVLYGNSWPAETTRAARSGKTGNWRNPLHPFRSASKTFAIPSCPGRNLCK